MKEIDIYWGDLTEKAQKNIAELIEINVDEVPYEMNWDTFPMATIP